MTSIKVPTYKPHYIVINVPTRAVVHAGRTLRFALSSRVRAAAGRYFARLRVDPAIDNARESGTEYRSPLLIFPISRR